MIQPALTPLEQQQLNVASSPAPTFWHHVRFEVVRRSAEQLGFDAVLDFGAGSGLLGDHLHNTGLTYRFAEASDPLRRALLARFGRGALAGDADPIEADTLVALLDVIEHADDDGAVLGSLARRMAPCAGLIVTAPAMRWLLSSWDRDLGHHRRYHRREAATVVRSAGFEVLEASYLFPELVPIALLRWFRSSDGTAAEFPSIPGFVDRMARVLGRATVALRPIWPLGTSVLVIARRAEGGP